MTDELDISTVIDGVVQQADVQAELAASDQIDERFLKRQLNARVADIANQLSGERQKLLLAERALEDQLAAYAPVVPWYDKSYRYSIAFLLLAAGALLILWLAGSQFPDRFLGNAFTPGSPSSERNILINAAAIAFLPFAAQLWLVWLNRRRAARKRTDPLATASELKFTDALNEMQLAGTEVVLRHALDIINSSGSPFFQDRLVLAAAPDQAALKVSSPTGLTEVADPMHEADTVARRGLLRLLEAQDCASIGVSGPRGSGKSTLLRSLTAGNLFLRGKQAITVYSAAPVDYEPRDFLLHLFATLCRQVLLTHGVSDERRRNIAHIRRLRENILRNPRIAMVAGAILLCVGVAALLTAFGAAWFVSQNDTPLLKAMDLKPGNLLLFGLAATMLGIVVLYYYFITSSLLRRGAPPAFAMLRTGLTRDEESDPLILRSLEELEEIHFQRSFTSGWSGAIKSPVGFEVSASGGMSLAQRQESLPELVHRFRTYASDVAQEHGTVVIAIDELDKIREPVEAEEFVNEIKSIFGITGCFYLISVSEDAMSSFERRGLALRDAFDSAFDDIRYIDYVDLVGARKILGRRILNLPDPFLCLCYVISGGLPRDLIRIARAMFQSVQGPDTAPSDLRSITTQLIQSEVAAKVRASRTAARSVNVEPETSTFLTSLAEERDWSNPAGLSTLAAKLAVAHRLPAKGVPPDPDAPLVTKLVAIQRELSAYLQFLELCLKLAIKIETSSGWNEVTGNGCVDRLARARQGLEINVGAGSSRLDAVRTALA